MKTNYFKTPRATFNLTVHIVLVTKYRRNVFQKEHLEFLRIAFQNIAEKWKAKIIEINGESDHVHILLTYPPHKLLSSLIANLKSTSCQLMWDNLSDHLKEIYGQDKRILWTGAYFVASCGGVTIDQLKKYVENQDSPEY
ncbi:MAG: IS200/IS605 family transposase [Microcystis aeruginosa Ma_QC_C_20070703_M131]|uniref:IS200/IS605 family transposase n=1 Tax=Microcystis aeruginosa Ma_QC_C_20070703_M131 TaxID=2486263 RepID=A0A551XW02_MICAE|nr:MAG: IS200/IS605 family transposase [Microcystis aeruginosa Ma_QC_C_20070703_M131]